MPEARDAVYHVAMLKSTLRNPVGSARSRWRTFFANQLHFCLALGVDVADCRHGGHKGHRDVEVEVLRAW